MGFLHFVMLGFLLVTSLTMPTPKIDDKLDVLPKLNSTARILYQEGPFSEGDIALPVTRNGNINKESRWPGAVIPYVLAPTAIGSSAMALLQEAIQDFSLHTCVRWVKRTTQENYVYISHDDYEGRSGCWSVVGLHPGITELNLEIPNCNYKGIYLHEMMHVLGFWHEHNRPDRDDYVQVHLENVQNGSAGNFDKMSPLTTSTFGVEYDYGSIMHYDPYTFSSNYQPTLTPKKPLNGAVMGEYAGFSTKDYWKINRMYNCVDYDTGL